MIKARIQIDNPNVNLTANFTFRGIATHLGLWYTEGNIIGQMVHNYKHINLTPNQITIIKYLGS